MFLFKFGIVMNLCNNLCFAFIETDDNFDAPELMENDVIDDYDDDAGNEHEHVAEEAEVKCRKTKILNY